MAADDPAVSKLENSEGWRAGKSGTVGSIGKRGVYLPTMGSIVVTVGVGVNEGTSMGWLLKGFHGSYALTAGGCCKYSVLAGDAGG